MQAQVTPLDGSKALGITFTGKPVTAFGGLALFVAFAERIGLAAKLAEAVHDGETGLLVEPHSSAALAGAIIRFYEEKMEAKLRRNIVQQKRFSWAELARTLESVAETRMTG